MGNSESNQNRNDIVYGTGNGGLVQVGRDAAISQSANRNAAMAVQAPSLPPVSPNTPPPGGGPSVPGAFKMAGQPRNQRFYVTIPRGVRPGQHFAVLVNGQQMMVTAILCYITILVL